ncbi:MAG: hypothetical protein ABJA67_12780 [Chthonomonadales bacterium]
MSANEYSVMGADGAWHGPVDLDQLIKWADEGRISRHTLVRVASTEETFTAETLDALYADRSNVGVKKCRQCGMALQPHKRNCPNCGVAQIVPPDNSSFALGVTLGDICALVLCWGWMVVPFIAIYGIIKSYSRFNAGLGIGFTVGILGAFAVCATMPRVLNWLWTGHP